jgi:hypothetical protein
MTDSDRPVSLSANPDKEQLARSPAGRRMIAQITLYNKGDFPRLRTFILESYTPEQLAEQPIGARMMELRARRAALGRLRIAQTALASEHEAVVLLRAETGGPLRAEHIVVEEAYPHRITQYDHVTVVDENAAP